MHSVRHAMNLRIRAALEFIAYIVVVSLIWMAVPVQAHSIDCGGRAGIDLARCERHQKMAEKCGPLQSEAHFACDREFLLQQPLQCTALAGGDVQRCEAEVLALKACEPKAGREFMRCVRDAAKASPMGAP